MNIQSVSTETLVERPRQIYVHPTIHLRVKHFAFRQGKSMQNVAEVALSQWLDMQEQEGKAA